MTLFWAISPKASPPSLTSTAIGSPAGRYNRGENRANDMRALSAQRAGCHLKESPPALLQTRLCEVIDVIFSPSKTLISEASYQIL